MSFSSHTFLVRSLHAWRIALLCIVITHQRSHLALAILIVVPLNHILFNLTASLDPRAGESSTSRKFLRRVLGHTPSEPINDGIVIGLYLLATAVLVWLYGSLVALWADVRAFAATWEWWVMFGLLIALTILYRPVGRAIRELLRAAGLKDKGMWAALGLAVCLWVWCDAVFAAVYQKLALECSHPASTLCGGRLPFSVPLTRFADAAYFSTVTLSTTGYGDIAPVSDIARAIVSLEIIIAYGLLGFLLSRVAGLTRSAPRPEVPRQRE